MQILFADRATDDVLNDLLSGQAVLWVTETDLSDLKMVDAFRKLVRAPWRGVFLESTSAAFAQALSQDNESGQWSAKAGFLHLIASDPTSIILPRRSQPVFFLNGREDREGAESASLTARTALRRRLNMIAQLRDLEPKRIVVVGRDTSVAIDELIDLWSSEFRALVTVVAEDTDESTETASKLESSTDLQAVSWIRQSPDQFASDVAERAATISEESTTLVTVRSLAGDLLTVDVARAELAEQPMSDACAFIEVRDTLPVSPRDLSEDEFKGFFTKSEPTWRAFAAGLPWTPDWAPERELLGALQECLLEPAGTVRIFSVVSEPGAGGTTQARALAFAAAKVGFPVLSVKQQSEVPSALEITNFLHRANSVIEAAALEAGRDAGFGEPVWLMVLDVQHFDGGSDEFWRFCAELVRSGRKVCILKVAEADTPLQPPKGVSHVELTYVNHDLDLDGVTSLGDHLNVFLRNVGREKSREEWRAFWDKHRPDIDTGIASFWIALEFWLAGFLELGESIQGWALRQYRDLQASPEVKCGMLEIAALSVERRALPERLLPPLSAPRVPWSQALDDARRASPGLSLLQADAVPLGRVWAIAHDVLSRYLVNSVWNDRTLCAQLGIEPTADPVALRLHLISRVVRRPQMGEAFARPLAIALASQVLKLDEQTGNAEFLPHWREVLSILEQIPAAVRDGSRIFNHHLAISRRRVTQGEIFQINPEEKKRLLLQATDEVAFALDRIVANVDDEPDLNLLNTLALLYQDLAALERSAFGDKNALAHYLAKSDDATRRALKENPNNSYVLETAAKNLLRKEFEADETSRVQAAAEALCYVFQASALDSATSRRMSLGNLAQEALRVLESPFAGAAVDQLCKIGSPFGFVAKAWRSLPRRKDTIELVPWENIQSSEAAVALEILRSSPQRDWLLVRLQYDLEAVADPNNFALQLALLDELADTAGYRLSLQQRLERAVLLQLEGRHKPATDEFYSLRKDVRTSQAILSVPDRLRWLLVPSRDRRATCSARVIDSSSGRPLAKVVELAGAHVPFTPQEFGKSRMAVGELFKCQVTFSAMGPFLKPASGFDR